jgi:predicted glycogen debranching enzyme
VDRATRARCWSIRRTADPGAASIIAGYHRFGDWGRDTMIALPGIALTTNRAPVAEKILRTFARFVDAAMLPNYFPNPAEPEPNRPTVNSI